jgi:uncharacterized protein
MRMRSTLALVVAATALAAAVPEPASAQYGEPIYQPRRGYYAPPPGTYYRPAPPGYVQPPPGYYYPQPQPQRRAYGNQPYYPGTMVRPAPQPGFSLRRLFGVEEEAPRPVQPAVPRARPPRPKPPVAVARQVKPKVDPSTYVVVFGDALADQTGQGLDDAFEETPDVAVARKTKAEGGLARGEAGEWPKFIRETLDGGQKATVAVVMLGANDRQTIREGEISHEPLADRWKELYRERVDGVVRSLAERGLPVIWVGIPPMKNDKLSADYIAMNEIIRESTERLGGTYVDIWPGFVNDENRYTATGPDVDGQTSRLRTNDGVLFTRAGARKAAHFADAEIKRILEARKAGTAVAAVPNPAAPVEGAPADPLANLPPPHEVPGAPSLPLKPAVGPVLPLTKPALSPGGTLMTARPKLDGEAAYTIQKALREGVSPNPRPGRADDFRWPRS